MNNSDKTKLDLSLTSWDFTSLYNGDNDPQIDRDKEIVKEKCYKFIDKWKDRNDYLEEPSILVEALEEFEILSSNYGITGKFGYYIHLRTVQEQDNVNLKAKLAKIIDYANQISNDLQFFTHRISKIDPKKQYKFLSYTELQEYRHFLESLFIESKYLLSEPEEKILTLKSKTSYGNWVRMLESFLSKEESEILDEDGKPASKSFEEVMSLMNSKNKEVRDSAASAFNQILKKHLEVAENEFNSVLEHKKTSDQLRGHSRPDEASHIDDDVETSVVDALIKSVSESNNVSKSFYKLKARLLGLPKLAYHERNLEYGKIEKDYNWEDSVNLVYKVFDELDGEFGEIFRKFVNDGQLDAFPKKGKSGGAFCTMGSKIYPVYLLLNHTNKLRDVSTIAHEAGHGVNHYLINKHEKSLNSGNSLFTAEVASTFMEDFVFQEILKSADDELKLNIKMQRLNDDVSTIFRQIAFYRFEQEIHEEFRKEGYLSKEKIGEIFQKHMVAYMGDYVSQDPGSQNWWLYVGHFRRYFYVYSYASGLIISKAMQREVKKNPEFILKVKKFLSVGSSLSPKDNFLSLGIDVSDQSFWKQGIMSVLDELQETEKLAEKLGKI
jgi:oligoendopeptidase F